ncbi:GNAT family N-acetyltransferase [Hyphomonas sp.]|uniref:GNAT family N-acetyltransferase n=1 Tax=Hyphomonas sp. TaxID=87 RepID=UPI00391B1E22
MLDIHLPDGMRTATRADWKRIGDVTGEAFAQDPVNLWIFGNPEALPPLFRILAQDIYLPNGVCHLAGDAGATMWCHSDRLKGLGNWALWKLIVLQAFKGAPGSMKRGLGAAEAMDREHPKEPHMYLFTIGTRKAARGQGLGKKLIQPMLDAADRAALPCYLENSNPANTGFYVSHGFERMKLFEPGPGGPPLEAMWREPRQPLGSE